MGENYVWAPVEDGEYACTCPECFGELEDHTPLNYYVNDRGRTLGIVDREDEDDYREVELAPDVRVCRRVELPRPDWSTAPDWAQWAAINADGWLRWHEHEPDVYDGESIHWTSGGMDDDEDFVQVPIGIDWRLLKYRRPEGE